MNPNARKISNVDNIFALFKSPNKTIIEKFKEGLQKLIIILDLTLMNF